MSNALPYPGPSLLCDRKREEPSQTKPNPLALRPDRPTFWSSHLWAKEERHGRRVHSIREMQVKCKL